MESDRLGFLPRHLSYKIGLGHWGIWRKKAEFRVDVIHIIVGPGFLKTHSGG